MAVDVNAELKRRRASDGALISWDVNDDGSTPVADAEVRTRLAGLANELTLQSVRDRLSFPLPATQVSDLKSVGITNNASNPVLTSPVQRENRLDYAGRTDGNPVYVGDAAPGTLTTAAAWNVFKLEYDTSNRLTRKQVRQGVVWDQRTVGW